MSRLGVDSAGQVVQAFLDPLSGQTEQVVTVAGSAKMAAAAAQHNWYRLFIPAGTETLRFAVGPFATAAATATDMPRGPGEYFVFVPKGSALAIFATVAGVSIDLSLQPS